VTIDRDKARKRPFRCGWCMGARFFVYSDRNDVVCVKCRAVFHVYPLESDLEHAARFKRDHDRRAID
jgi:hypothetical protein